MRKKDLGAPLRMPVDSLQEGSDRRSSREILACSVALLSFAVALLALYVCGTGWWPIGEGMFVAAWLLLLLYEVLGKTGEEDRG